MTPLKHCARCGQPRTPAQLGRGQICGACRPCVIPRCRNPIANAEHGWCDTHYRRWLDHPDLPVDREPANRQPCSAQPCDRLAVACGMCETHRRQYQRTGRTWPIPARPCKRWTAAEVAVEVELLLGTDSTDSIARRLGYQKREGLYLALRKAGRSDLADKLKAAQQAEWDALRETKLGEIYGPQPRKKVA